MCKLELLRQAAGTCIVTLVVLTLIAAAPPGVLAHGGDTSVIHACVFFGGEVEIVDANDQCPVKGLGFKALHWSPPVVPGYELGVTYSFAGPYQRVQTSATCPPGKFALGGGVKAPGDPTSPDFPFGGFVVNQSGPFPDLNPDQWLAEVTNQTATNQFFNVYVICANILEGPGNFGPPGLPARKIIK